VVSSEFSNGIPDTNVGILWQGRRLGHVVTVLEGDVSAPRFPDAAIAAPHRDEHVGAQQVNHEHTERHMFNPSGGIIEPQRLSKTNSVIERIYGVQFFDSTCC
jgi:hypothetical protein